MLTIPFDVAVKLALAFLLGGLIGLEREFHGKPAGLRTHILVCLASTVLMILTGFFQEASQGASRVLNPITDPGRVAAGIVTGIGFLGAGVIIREGDSVRGLTTAACVWFTAVLGIVIGGGQYMLAFCVTLLCLLVLLLFDRVDHIIHTVIRRRIHLVVCDGNFEAVEDEIDRYFKSQGLRIKDKWHAWDRERGCIEIGYLIRTVQRMQSGAVLRKLSGLEGVSGVRWE